MILKAPKVEIGDRFDHMCWSNMPKNQYDIPRFFAPSDSALKFFWEQMPPLEELG